MENELFDLWKDRLEYHKISLTQKRWILAVSGGVDSAVLLHLCAQLLPYYGTPLTVVHCNHQLRGPVGEGESELVQSWCRNYQIPIRVETLDVENFATKFKLSIQEAARILRKQTLKNIAAEEGGSYIFTAHHSSDAVEWFLMRLLRGSGTEGLAGHEYKNGVWVKSLIPFNREDIRQYAREQGLPFVEDPSNEDTKYLRNRIRHQLIPQLNGVANTEVEPLLLRTMNNLREDADYLMHVARLEYDRWSLHKKGEVQLPRERLDQIAPSLKRRIYQLAFTDVIQGKNFHTPLSLEKKHIDMIHVLQTEHELPLGVRVYKHGDHLCFYRALNQAEKENLHLPAVLTLPGVTDLIRYEMRCVAVTQSVMKEKTPWRQASPMNAYVDWAKISGPVRVRRVTKADRIKVSPTREVECLKYLKKLQIPQRLREEALVFEDEKGIIWLAPYCVDARYWATEESRILVKLQLRPLKDVVARQKGSYA